MFYFIDFEATQFSNEIISVGCVSENGDKFYQEVKANSDITPFITNLTGITKESNNKALSSDEVFSMFFDWLSSQTDKSVTFICYGNSDIDFIKKNLTKTHSLKAQAALSIIGFNLHDYSRSVKLHFGLAKNISLLKLIAYCRKDNSIIQNHNALEDALMLKEVFDYISNEPESHGHPFLEYESEEMQEKIIKYTSHRDYLHTIKHRIEQYDSTGMILETVFSNIDDASNAVLLTMNKKDRNIASVNKIQNKIISANRKHCPYNNNIWKIIIEED